MIRQSSKVLVVTKDNITFVTQVTASSYIRVLEAMKYKVISATVDNKILGHFDEKGNLIIY